MYARHRVVYQHDARESPNARERERYTVMGPYSREPFRFFEELAPEVDYPIFSLLEDFENSGVFPKCFDNDPHWNADGHGVAAAGQTPLRLTVFGVSHQHHAEKRCGAIQVSHFVGVLCEAFPLRQLYALEICNRRVEA